MKTKTKWTLGAGRTITTPDGEFYLAYGQDKYGNPNFKDFCELDRIAHWIVDAHNGDDGRDELAAALQWIDRVCSNGKGIDMSDDDIEETIVGIREIARAALAKYSNSGE